MVAPFSFQSRQRCITTFLMSVNVVSKTLVLAISCLLLNGAVLHGIGTQDFPPIDGKFLQMTSGHTIYYRCTGNSTTYPPVVILGNPEQGMADFLGIFDLIQSREPELRVCVWDPPGLGYSEYTEPESAKEDQEDVVFFLKSLSEDTQYSKPYFLMGFEKGGNAAEKMASDHPELVSEILLVETVGPNFYPRTVEASLQEEGSVAPPVIRAMLEGIYTKEYRHVKS